LTLITAGHLKVSAEPLTTKLLQVFEARLPVRKGQMEMVGCNTVCSLDWTKRNGEKAGTEWLATLVDVDSGVMLWQRGVKTTSVDEIADDLSRVGDRSNFNAVACMIDNVPLVSEPQNWA